MINHCFFGKDCQIPKSLNGIQNLEEKLKTLNFDFKFKPAFLNQIHSNKVIVIDQLDKIYSSPLPKADSLVTNIQKLPICVVTADCLPIIFKDEKKQIIAITHAGWRGAKAGIIENTIKEMFNLGADISNIKAIIGPAILQNSYEVSHEFYQEFLDESKNNEEFFFNSKKVNHYMFDLSGYAVSKLKKIGIKEIKDVKIDTYKNEKAYFSFRRVTHKNEKDCGRNISIVML